MIRLMCVMCCVGCALTARVTPSVVVDGAGKVGVQVVAGAGFSFGHTDHTGEGIGHEVEIGIEAGGQIGAGALESGGQIGSFIDFVVLPTTPEDGLGARIGLHSGFRPSDVDGSATNLDGVGLALALFYRVTQIRSVNPSTDKPEIAAIHYFGIEARCDTVFPSSDTTHGKGLCMFGPSYEILFPLADSMGHL